MVENTHVITFPKKSDIKQRAKILISYLENLFGIKENNLQYVGRSEYHSFVFNGLTFYVVNGARVYVLFKRKKYYASATSADITNFVSTFYTAFKNKEQKEREAKVEEQLLFKMTLDLDYLFKDELGMNDIKAETKYGRRMYENDNIKIDIMRFESNAVVDIEFTESMNFDKLRDMAYVYKYGLKNLIDSAIKKGTSDLPKIVEGLA